MESAYHKKRGKTDPELQLPAAFSKLPLTKNCYCPQAADSLLRSSWVSHLALSPLYPPFTLWPCSAPELVEVMGARCTGATACGSVGGYSVSGDVLGVHFGRSQALRLLAFRLFSRSLIMQLSRTDAARSRQPGLNHWRVNRIEAPLISGYSIYYWSGSI